MANLHKFTVQESLNTDTAAVYDEQSTFTLSNGSASTSQDVSSYTTVALHTNDTAYFTWNTATSTANISTDSLKLGAGLTFLKIPKGLGSSIFLTMQKVSGNVAVRWALM
tara:strand:+ start:195 stop:524 length:330 start_codon:yes stop_codon:yes gene_type:complete